MLLAPFVIAELNTDCANSIAIPAPEVATPIVVVVVSGCSRMSPVVVMLFAPPAALMSLAVIVISPPTEAVPVAALTLPSVSVVESVSLIAFPFVVDALTVPVKSLLAWVNSMAPEPALKDALLALAACVMGPDCVMPTAEIVRVPVPRVEVASCRDVMLLMETLYAPELSRATGPNRMLF